METAITLSIVFGLLDNLIGILSIDNELDDNFFQPRQTGSGFSFSASKIKFKRCIRFPDRRQLFVSEITFFVMALKDFHRLLPLSRDDGLFDDDEFIVLYDSYSSKNPCYPHDSYSPFDLEDLDESESVAAFRFRN